MNWIKMDGQYDTYLRDESRQEGRCDAICFPRDAQELRQALLDCVSDGVPLTVQGARTGIAGAGIPLGGRLISTEKLNRSVLCGDTLEAQCGVRLQEVQSAARAAGLVFPPAPTEDTATLGGLFACAASGPNGCRYGGLAAHVLAATALLPDGRTWALERGRCRFDRSGCPLPGGGRLELHTPIPGGNTPRWGFAPQAGMDLLDLFSGSEGTLALLADFRLTLSPRPAQIWGLLFFFQEESAALDFAASLSAAAPPQAELAAVEYLDGATLRLVSALKETSTRLRGLPPFPARRGGAVYVELEFSTSAPPQRALMDCMSRFARRGGDAADTWAASGQAELERLRLLRHAAAEAVNVRLDQCRRALPGLTKLCGSFQTPPDRTAQAAGRYRRDMDAAQVPGAVFGHASTGCLHVNLLPETELQRQRALELLEAWAGFASELGGHALAENGAGKTRRSCFARWAPPEQRALMAEIKRFFDPAGLLGPGTLLETRPYA